MADGFFLFKKKDVIDRFHFGLFLVVRHEPTELEFDVNDFLNDCFLRIERPPYNESID